MKLYGDHRSGNCYKVYLTAALVGAQIEWVDVDIMQGDTQTTTFKALNPVGKIPLLVLDNGQCLSESNAIINFLAHGTDLLPKEPWEFAQVQQWQFYEQYSHEPYIAVARFIRQFQGMPISRQDEFQAKQAGGHAALKIMEQQLKQKKFLANDRFSVADISLYAYTHVAAEGGFDLSVYPAILRWLDTVAKQPSFVPMVNN
ncbi:MAG: glutathione S-transferase family protein [Marinicella sp.]